MTDSHYSSTGPHSAATAAAAVAAVAAATTTTTNSTGASHSASSSSNSSMLSRSSHGAPNSSTRSKSHSTPRVLPFPDIPATPKSPIGSTSPSPAPTRSSSSLGHRASADGGNEGSSSSSSGGGLAGAVAPSMTVTRSADSTDAMSSSAGGDRARRHTATATPPISSPLSVTSPLLTSTTTAPAVPSILRNRALTSPSPRPITVPVTTTQSSRVDVFSEAGSLPDSAGPSTFRAASSYPSTTFAPVLEVRSTSLPNDAIPASDATSLSPPRSVQIVPPPSQKIVSDHVYASFLSGKCADLRIWVRKWGVGWRVHKMVLIQAGFFHSLFLGGFSEMHVHHRSDKGKDKALCEDDWHGENLELTFDDPNITRAAFEITLSRLYSPFPHLHFPNSLVSTSPHPLSSAFVSGAHPDMDFASMYHSTPKDVQLVTPRLLLSILSTAIYLGHTSLMREVLGIVLRTVSPMTITRYLAFALGDGIGPEEWADQDVASAKGLEDVGQKVVIVRPSEADDQASFVNSDEEGKVGDTTRSSSHPASPSSSSTPTVKTVQRMGSLSRATDTSTISDADFPMPQYYGFPSDKIGEACACWIAKWGVDVLDIESTLPASSPVRIWRHRGLPANFLRAALSSDSFHVKDEYERYRVARRVLDLRRMGWEEEMDTTGDLSLNSTSPEECEEWNEDESHLEAVFADGIYYTHMNFDGLSHIAQDVDPSTGMPFAPLSVLQSAHWSAADLRARVRAVSASNELDIGSLGLTQTTSQLVQAFAPKRRFTPRSRLSSSSTDLSITSNVTAASGSRLYHPVPVDDTHRIGASGLIFSLAPQTALSGMPGLPDLGPDSETVLADGSVQRRPPPQGEHTSFGLQNGSRTLTHLQSQHSLNLAALSLGSGNKRPEQSWTTSEPFRFSAEFWGIDKLPDKERAYSQTHFYAGSWFNVYVQPNRKKDKGVQLGIYLQRQSTSEAMPAPSAPSIRTSTRGNATETRDRTEGHSDSAAMLESSLAARFGLTVAPPPTAPSSARPTLSRSTSIPPLTVGSPARQGFPGLPRPTGAFQGLTNPKEQYDSPYEDTRPLVKAYFSISCSSALGTGLIRFSSAPDSFTMSQSWGWKSSALRSEEYISTSGISPTHGESLEDGVLGWVGNIDTSDLREGVEGGLRATVVVGLV
ncbi:hypothetical protein BD324DRAFT_682080 [Kockovaella imperatae]|uniref:BTB domain-containing protein n=1 Tax=Kockovaella imperatae TaxID=4999 RepID=A0A1Y1UCZ6_9TREE|nr:hypothetical protein BD324DRAFT_682080 [Kockovaella imperatae]ORX35928.1 hypothetical protein BD324DRAFT_682080 [Kockovaella imperatae]